MHRVEGIPFARDFFIAHVQSQKYQTQLTHCLFKESILRRPKIFLAWCRKFDASQGSWQFFCLCISVSPGPHLRKRSDETQ
jgi:hypothetical protein